MRVVSFCTPVKNRSDELLRTLAINLSENRPHQDKVEFIIAIFDDDDRLACCLRSLYPDEIASGYLKVCQVPGLEYWHFGRAKNAFKDLMSGKLYSSLDGDNFVSSAETAQIIEAYNEHGENILFHHFSGTWGDGTCGRVTLGAELYRSIGYDNNFFPRQFDEMDLILSTLRARPDTVCLGYSEDHLFAKSKRLSAFCKEEGISIRHKCVPDLRTAAPLNPKGEGYVRKSGWLDSMQAFNIASSLLKNSSSPEQKYKYCDEARSAGSELIEKGPEDEISRWFFGIERSSLPQVAAGSVPVVACIKNEVGFLVDWYRHYKRIGAGPFFIIDDGSDTPIEKFLPFDDVHVLHPAVGRYFTCKAIWIKAAMKCFVPENAWTMMVDADEFVDIPSRWSSVHGFVRAAEASKLAAVPGLLIDMLPRSSRINNRTKLAHFNRHLLHCSHHEPSYGEHNSVKWAFGDCWKVSRAVDARYHLFGTIDVLRKVPLAKNVPGMTLNQGFHDLATPSQKSISNNIWKTKFVLPIRHYKLMKLFNSDQRRRLAEQAATPFVYFARTTENFVKMLKPSEDELRSTLQGMRLVKYNPNIMFGEKIRYLMGETTQASPTSPYEKIISRIGFLRKWDRKRKIRIAEAGRDAAVWVCIMLGNLMGSDTALDALVVFTS